MRASPRRRATRWNCRWPECTRYVRRRGLISRNPATAGSGTIPGFAIARRKTRAIAPMAREGDRLPRSKPTDIRRRLYELLEQGPIGERRTRFVSRVIILMIVVNLAAAALETVPALEAEHHRLFATIEWLSLALFTEEYLARVWVAVEHAPDRHLSPAKARLKFITSPSGLIDLFAVM